MRDLRRTGKVSGWHRSKRTYKRERKGERSPVSSRTTAKYRKRGENHVTEQSAVEMGRGRQSTKRVGKGRGNQRSKGGEVDQFHE
jgi:hypothetical protein